MFGVIFTGICLGICALFMIGIGIANIRSKKPVGFYSGEKGPDPDKVSDLHGWNMRHGCMWIIYGVIIIITWVIGLIFGDSPIIVISYTIGLLGPIPLMIWYHHRLIKKYVID